MIWHDHGYRVALVLTKPQRVTQVLALQRPYFTSLSMSTAGLITVFCHWAPFDVEMFRKLRGNNEEHISAMGRKELR